MAVLITITLAFGTTALLKSVMRPVTEALVDRPRTGTEEDRITARASVNAAFRDALDRSEGGGVGGQLLFAEQACRVDV